MTTKRGTKAERMEQLRKWGSKNEHVRFICDHHRLKDLHPMDRLYFEEDVSEIIDIAFERGIHAGRQYALREFDFLVS